jgi:hypothetical protein
MGDGFADGARPFLGWYGDERRDIHNSAGGCEIQLNAYSRDHHSDCRPVVIALVVTPEGFPLAYEVLAG